MSTLSNESEEIEEKNQYMEIKLLPMNCGLFPLTRADVSVILKQGENVIIASMSGPIGAKLQNQQYNNASVEVYYRSKAGPPNLKNRLQEIIIKNICETSVLTALYPRSAISIQLQEMENKNGLEACAINACCLALLISGISMKFTFAAIHCIIDKNGELILDPDYKKAKDYQSDFTFVFDSVSKNVIAVNARGRYKLAQFNDALKYSQAASDLIFKFYKKCVANLLPQKL